MKIVYKNVDLSSLSILDQWISDKDSDMVKFAMFDYSFSSYDKLLKEDKIDGESYITKIVYVDNILLGYLALCYFQ